MKTCCRCHTPKELECFYKDKSKLDGHSYICLECHRKSQNKPAHQEAVRRWNSSLRETLFAQYGRCCKYCGANKDLHFDHMGGGKHKIKEGTTWYTHLKKEGFPKECQVLCRRCNMAKQDMSDSEFRAWILDMAKLLHPDKIPA